MMKTFYFNVSGVAFGWEPGEFNPIPMPIQGAVVLFNDMY